MTNIYIVRWLHHPGIEGVFAKPEAAHTYGELLAHSVDPDDEDADCCCVSVEEWSVSEATGEQAKLLITETLSRVARQHPIAPKDLN